MATVAATSMDSCSIKAGDVVTLRTTEARLARYRGRRGKVLLVKFEVVGGREIAFANVELDQANGEDAPVYLRDIIASSLSPAPKDGKAKRRSPLNLHAPKDERSEAERMDEGLSWLLGLNAGYGVLRVGQSRTAAICHACSRKSRKEGGKGFVQIHCRECGSLGYSPSTNSTKGTPDSFLFNLAWPPYCMAAVEWKDGPKGERSDEQEVLEAQRRIVVAWDTPSLARALVAFERSIGFKSHEAALHYALTLSAEEMETE